MNILVVSDNFTKGGLETQIATFWNYLKKDNTLWFCFANYEDRGLVDSDYVYTGFHFSFYETLTELKADVDRLIGIISERNIDVIHVHPWYGLYPAYFAASFTGVKLVYTNHGAVSVNYNGDIPNELFMQEIITTTASQVFCVSQEGLEALQSVNCGRTTLLRNPVSTDNFPSVPQAGTHRWALVSRLDSDKAPAIISFLKMLPELDIETVDIYGRGDHENHIKAHAEKVGKEISFLGHCDNLSDKLIKGDYDGVVGLGRCAIEGLALGLPVLLIGYGRVIGLIDSECYDIASRSNFVPLSIKEKSISEINRQISESYYRQDEYNHRKKIIKEFGTDSVCDLYINKLNESIPMSSTYVRDLYNDLMSIHDPEKVLLHASNEVWEKFKERVGPRTRNIYVKDMIMMENQIAQYKELNDFLYRGLKSEIEAYSNTVEELRSENRRLISEIEKQGQEIQRINQKVEAMGFRYFVNQSIEWRKNQFKKK